MHKFGTVYRPQTQGKVERMNQAIKTKLAKVCAQTKLSWLDALPIAVMSYRMAVQQRKGFTPYELLTGSQVPGPGMAPEGTPEHVPFLPHSAFPEQLKALVSSFSKQALSPSLDPGKPVDTHFVYQKGSGPNVGGRGPTE